MEPVLEIRRAHPEDADALTRVAHAAKRHWRYPETWIRLWTEALTGTSSTSGSCPS